MNIEAEKFKIEMSQSELWNTAFDIRYSIEYTLKTHWVNHQSTWLENEKERLHRMEKMFTHLGRIDLYNDIFSIAKTIFEEFNKKTE